MSVLSLWDATPWTCTLDAPPVPVSRSPLKEKRSPPPLEERAPPLPLEGSLPPPLGAPPPPPLNEKLSPPLLEEGPPLLLPPLLLPPPKGLLPLPSSSCQLTDSVNPPVFSPELAAIMRPGTRFKMLMGAGASWYGGFTDSVRLEDDGLQALCAFDDGDIRKYTGKMLEQYLTMKTIDVAHEDEGGIIDNVKGLWKAEKILFGLSRRDKMVAVGVLVGRTDEHHLGGAPIYMEHRASSVTSSEIAKKSFVRSPAVAEESLRNGFQTLRRGDRVSYVGAIKSARSEVVPCAVVYGLLVYEHPEHAQRKVVILYEENSTIFFLGFWAQWQRILRRNIAAGSLDGSLDKDASVQRCEEAEVDLMLEHYKTSLSFVHLQGFDTIEEILRLSALPPPRATSTKPSTRKVEQSPLVPSGSAEKGHDEHHHEATSMQKAGRGGRGEAEAAAIDTRAL